ncbi:MAG: DUF742 domain-containing protein [Actinomycetia bacterium]|nr:DUF742 domain-containing protein [Actinomycetes bacterium]MCP3910090.1 DUF742 domain-containing protein [Actinomycetes bacterium]MCP4084872.1 DUF742 domain-containing protein [Actinomycetes bacterium]
MAEPPKPRFVRQFMLTGGRTRSIGIDLPLDALVETAGTPSREDMASLNPEERHILELARATISIAEIGAHLGVHLGITRVLVSDLANRRLVALGTIDPSSRPSLTSLEKLFDDLIDY